MVSCGFETEISHCLLISLNVLKFSYLIELSNLLYTVLPFVNSLKTVTEYYPLILK